MERLIIIDNEDKYDLYNEAGQMVECDFDTYQEAGQWAIDNGYYIVTLFNV